MNSPLQLRVISHGGGVQTTALLVLAAERRIDFPVFLFANVGDDSEHPGTLDYLREIAKPYADRHGIELLELKRRWRDGHDETLYQQLTRPESRSVPIPVRMANGMPGTRPCTDGFKIKVVDRWVREHGATADTPAVVGVGISSDEFDRVKDRRTGEHEIVAYPLLGIEGGKASAFPAGFDHPLKRSDCDRIIRQAGLPVPPKSACWFCPMKRPSQWAEQRRSEPALFARACDLERQLIERREALGRDPAFFTRFGVPLADAIPLRDVLDFGPLDDPSCDSGHCMT